MSLRAFLNGMAPLGHLLPCNMVIFRIGRLLFFYYFQTCHMFASSKKLQNVPIHTRSILVTGMLGYFGASLLRMALGPLTLPSRQEAAKRSALHAPRAPLRAPRERCSAPNGGASEVCGFALHQRLSHHARCRSRRTGPKSTPTGKVGQSWRKVGDTTGVGSFGSPHIFFSFNWRGRKHKGTT